MYRAKRWAYASTAAGDRGSIGQHGGVGQRTVLGALHLVALGVRGIPALFMFKDGKVVSNRMGAAPKAALKSWIDESL